MSACRNMLRRSRGIGLCEGIWRRWLGWWPCETPWFLLVDCAHRLDESRALPACASRGRFVGGVWRSA